MNSDISKAETQVMVELGCGGTKSTGYIGIDRFPLHGVNIVADLNKGIPLRDNSVDVLFATHSLEHLENLENIVFEMYRVCKHRAIINIVAPYENMSVDTANYYHRIPFNEHTFRFFTKHIGYNYKNEFIIQPTIEDRWGLAESDNSICNIDIRTVNIEFIYFSEYTQCSEETKHVLRQNLRNICHSVIYSLVVWKDANIDLSVDEVENFKSKSMELLSATHIWPYKSYWESVKYDRPTIYSIYKKDKENNEARFETIFKCQKFYDNSLEKILGVFEERKVEQLANEIDKLSKSNGAYLERIEREGAIRDMTFSDDNIAMFNYLKNENIAFYDGLILRNKNVCGRSRLRYSDWLSSKSFQEYRIRKIRDNDVLFFYLDIKAPTGIIIEVVNNDGHIIFNCAIEILQNGCHTLPLKSFPKEFHLRFASIKGKPDIRVLELVNTMRSLKQMLKKHRIVTLASYTKSLISIESEE